VFGKSGLGAHILEQLLHIGAEVAKYVGFEEPSWHDMEAVVDTHWPAEEAQLWEVVTQTPLIMPVPVSVAVHAEHEVQPEGLEEEHCDRMQLGRAQPIISTSNAGAAWKW
jgi:hypothetical protein